MVVYRFSKMLGINYRKFILGLEKGRKKVWSKYVWKPQFCLTRIWTLTLFLVCRDLNLLFLVCRDLNLDQPHSMMGAPPRSPRLVMEPEKSPAVGPLPSRVFMSLVLMS